MNQKRPQTVVYKKNIPLANLATVCAIVILFFSCNVVKNVQDKDYLLTENRIEVDGKVNNEERVNNIPLQKPNTTSPFFNIPIKLHIYNLARPNIDSLLQSKIYDDSIKVFITK